MENFSDGELISKIFPDISPGELEKLDGFRRELFRWKRAKSLTRIREVDFIPKLILPSLWLRRFTVGVPALSILDLGSGAGIPGIPMAVCSPPEHRFVLLDRSQKKITFLKHAVRLLELTNAFPVCADAKTWSPDQEFSEGFDRVFSRSTGPVEEVLNVSARFLKEKGVLVLQKGGKALESMEVFPWEEYQNQGLICLGATAIGAGIGLNEGKLFLVQKCSTWNIFK